MKYCYKALNKQSSGVRERIIYFTLIIMGKWFRFSNKSVFEQPLGTRFHCSAEHVRHSRTGALVYIQCAYSHTPRSYAVH
jgi:hypothetical protein